MYRLCAPSIHRVHRVQLPQIGPESRFPRHQHSPRKGQPFGDGPETDRNEAGQTRRAGALSLPRAKETELIGEEGDRAEARN